MSSRRLNASTSRHHWAGAPEVAYRSQARSVEQRSARGAQVLELAAERRRGGLVEPRMPAATSPSATSAGALGRDREHLEVDRSEPPPSSALRGEPPCPRGVALARAPRAPRRPRASRARDPARAPASSRAARCVQPPATACSPRNSRWSSPSHSASRAAPRGHRIAIAR